MVDNIDITPGTGKSVRTDDVSGVHMQIVKLDAGGDGLSVPIVAGQQTKAASLPVTLASDQGALPVTVASLPLPSGAATSALQGGGLPAALGTGGGLKVDGSGTALPVSGTFYQATQPTSDNGPAWTSSYQHTASADASSGADATAAPASGQKIVVDDIILSTGVALTVTFEDETAGTDLLVLYMPANGVAQVTPRGRIKLPVADKKLRIKTSAAGAVACTVCYHSEA